MKKKCGTIPEKSIQHFWAVEGPDKAYKENVIRIYMIYMTSPRHQPILKSLNNKKTATCDKCVSQTSLGDR